MPQRPYYTPRDSTCDAPLTYGYGTLGSEALILKPQRRSPSTFIAGATQALGAMTLDDSLEQVVGQIADHSTITRSTNTSTRSYDTRPFANHNLTARAQERQIPSRRHDESISSNWCDVFVDLFSRWHIAVQYNQFHIATEAVQEMMFHYSIICTPMSGAAGATRDFPTQQTTRQQHGHKESSHSRRHLQLPRRPSRHRKRLSHPDRSGSDDDADSNTDRPSERKRSRADGGLLMACPYFVHNPEAYSSCSGERNTFRRWRYVKQHLNRRHYFKPCPICNQGFSGKHAEQNWQAHINERRCVPNSHEPEGVSRDQMQLLDSIRHRTTDREKWFLAWDILFPGLPRPNSCYIDGETAGWIRRLRRDPQEMTRFSRSLQKTGLCDTPESASHYADEILRNFLNACSDEDHDEGLGTSVVASSQTYSTHDAAQTSATSLEDWGQNHSDAGYDISQTSGQPYYNDGIPLPLEWGHPSSVFGLLDDDDDNYSTIDNYNFVPPVPENQSRFPIYQPAPEPPQLPSAVEEEQGDVGEDYHWSFQATGNSRTTGSDRHY